METEGRRVPYDSGGRQSLETPRGFSDPITSCGHSVTVGWLSDLRFGVCAAAEGLGALVGWAYAELGACQSDIVSCRLWVAGEGR